MKSTQTLDRLREGFVPSSYVRDSFKEVSLKVTKRSWEAAFYYSFALCGLLHSKNLAWINIGGMIIVSFSLFVFLVISCVYF